MYISKYVFPMELFENIYASSITLDINSSAHWIDVLVEFDWWRAEYNLFSFVFGQKLYGKINPGFKNKLHEPSYEY